MWSVTSYITRFAHPVTKDVGDYWQILMSVANPSAIFTTAAFGAATGVATVRTAATANTASATRSSCSRLPPQSSWPPRLPSPSSTPCSRSVTTASGKLTRKPDFVFIHRGRRRRLTRARMQHSPLRHRGTGRCPAHSRLPAERSLRWLDGLTIPRIYCAGHLCQHIVPIGTVIHVYKSAVR